MTTQIEEDEKKTRQCIKKRQLKRSDQVEYQAEEIEND